MRPLVTIPPLKPKAPSATNAVSTPTKNFERPRNGFVSGFACLALPTSRFDRQPVLRHLEVGMADVLWAGFDLRRSTSFNRAQHRDIIFAPGFAGRCRELAFRLWGDPREDDDIPGTEKIELRLYAGFLRAAHRSSPKLAMIGADVIDPPRRDARAELNGLGKGAVFHLPPQRRRRKWEDGWDQLRLANVTNCGQWV